MNLKTDFNTLAYDMINDTFADIAQPLTVKTDSSVYDEESGEMIDFNNTGVVILAIVGPFTNDKFEASDIEVGDLQAIVPVNALTQELFLQSDTFILGSIEYTAINITTDASESVYTIQLRK